MRILQILPELNVGGVETGTVDFAKYLMQKGHHPVVVSNGGRLVSELQKAGITHYTLPVHRKNILTAPGLIKKLRKIILDERIDIVHARSRVPGWIAYFACRHTPAQFITTCHGFYSTHLFSRVMGFAKLVIVPSEVIGRHMIDDFHVPPERIRVIPRSVDLERFNVRRQEDPGQSKFVISIVGRITPLKGHEYFLKAMAKVVRSMPFVKIWIIGDAPASKDAYKRELELLVRRLGLSEMVEFLGTRADVPQLLAQTDLLVMSSTVPESFGRVILEAQAVGVPVVATKVGGVMEIVDDEKTGLLVMPKDPDAMAQAVLRILKDRKFARQLTEAAREKLLSRYTLEHMASKTIEVYEELLKMMNILVIKISAVGDVILATASLKAIRKKLPTARIHCLVGKESRKVLQRCPYIDEMLVIDPRSSDKGFWRLVKWGRRLARYRFDKVIDFQNNTRSHLLAGLCFPRESYGYRRGKFAFLLTHPVALPKEDLPPVEHQFRILQKLGIEHRPEMVLELWPSDSDKKNVQKMLESEWLRENEKIIGINLAASEKWRSKNWPLTHIARLCDILAAQNVRVVMTGMEKDKPLARELLSMTKSKPINLVGKTDVPELAALIKRCHVYISPDSAPMHVAAAMRTPLIALFGPTSSRRHLPPGKQVEVLEKKPPCSPCYGPQCRIKTHVCMTDITPEEVAAKIKQLIEK